MTKDDRLHPDKEELAAFGLGKLDDAAHERIEQHIAECEVCCEYLQGRPNDDQVVSLLRDSDALLAGEPTSAGSKTSGVPIGTRVRYFGDYELLEEIARGGMGIVYKARQTRLNRIVALKMILARSFATKEDVRRFHFEAEAAAHLQHPGIVPVFEVGEHEGQHYYSMGFVDGAPLATRLAVEVLPPADAAALIKQVADAVQFAHEAGVIHRDLKPANILLDKAGMPHVTDFGLAKRVEGDSELTASGQVVGTPSYMPPEQAAGRIDRIGPTADVYGLGAILYAALTSRPPFQADRPVDTLMQVLEREPVSPRTLNPSVPRDLETICLKCLEKDRGRRYQSAAELAAELERFLDGRPITARPLGVMARCWRWCRRQPVTAALIAAVFVSLCVGTAVATYFAFEADRRAKGEAEQRSLAEQREREANDARDLAQQAQQTAEAETVKTREALRESERSYYFNLITTAHLEWQANNLQRARELLNAAPNQLRHWDELRNWEYDYLQRLCNSESMTLRGHSQWAMSVAFSSDGNWLASGSRDRTIRLWDLSTGQTRHVLRGHDGAITRVAFSRDGRWLASSSEDKSIRLWDVAKGELIQVLGSHANPAGDVAFSPDGTRVASVGNDRKIKIWNVDARELVSTFQQDFAPVYRLFYSPDGSRLAVVTGGSARSPGMVKVLDATTGRVLKTLRGHESFATCVSFSPDGQLVASGSFDGSVRIWNVDTGAELLTFDGHSNFITSLAFSGDGQRIATASSDLQEGGGRGAGEVKVWNAKTGQVELVLRGHTERVRQVAFSHDDSRIATAGYDGTVKIWSSRRQNHSLTIAGQSTVMAVAVSPDSRRIATAGSNVTIWDAATGSELSSFSGHSTNVGLVAFHQDGARVVSSGPREPVKVWDSQSGEELFSFDRHGSGVTGLCLHPDGRRIATAGSDQTVRIWDLSSGREELAIPFTQRTVVAISLDNDGKRIAVGFGNGRIAIHNAEDGSEHLSLAGHEKRIAQVAFSPDGSLIASSSLDGTTKLWEVRSGNLRHTLVGHTRNVTDVSFSPNGTRLATGSRDETVRLWDVRTGQPVLTLRGHPQGVLALEFSPDGGNLVSGGYGNSLRIWVGSAPNQR